MTDQTHPNHQTYLTHPTYQTYLTHPTHQTHLTNASRVWRGASALRRGQD